MLETTIAYSTRKLVLSYMQQSFMMITVKNEEVLTTVKLQESNNAWKKRMRGGPAKTVHVRKNLHQLGGLPAQLNDTSLLGESHQQPRNSNATV